MYLIDTSIWIDFFRKKDHKAMQKFYDILNNQIPYGVTGIIYQEILQGAANEKEWELLVSYIETQRFFHPKDPIKTYAAAAKIYYDGRRQGITIRSTIDCVIAQIAIENNLILLHNDKDYLTIQKVTPDLCLG